MRWIRSPMVVLVLAGGCAEKGPEVFGRFQESSATPMEAIAARESDFIDRELTVAGNVAEICQVARCWLDLEDGSRRLHVELLGFQAPRDAAGARCTAQGKLVEKDGRLVLLAKGISLER